MAPTDNGDLSDALCRIEQLREQLQSQARLAALGALVAGISHEIKNPLNLIQNFTGMSEETCREIEDLVAKQGDDLAPVIRQQLQTLLTRLDGNLTKAQEQGKRANAIVERMLTHGRNDNDDFEPADLNALVDDYLTLAYNGIRTSESDFNVQIEKHYDPHMSDVNMSAQAVGQAFLNIITNALQALLIKKSYRKNFGAKLKIVTKDRDDVVEISIRDNGIGIKQEDLPRIFKPFFTTRQRHEGTGLGLSISYDIIVTQHKGDIAVSSSEDKYTEFLISLPRNIADVAELKKDSSTLRSGHQTK